MRLVFSAAAAAALLLAGCAGHSSPAAIKTAPPPVPVSHGSNRFEMTQHGQRMTADDFDAWMKARGIRVAKGAPPAPAARAGRAKPAAARSEADAQPTRRGSTPKRR